MEMAEVKAMAKAMALHRLGLDRLGLGLRLGLEEELALWSKLMGQRLELEEELALWSKSMGLRPRMMMEEEEERCEVRQEAENAPYPFLPLVFNTVSSKPVEETAEQTQLSPRVCMSPSFEENAKSTQRNELFKTVCMSHSQPCTLIIDSGSTNNLVASDVVEKLGLKRLKHPKPYRISWVQKGHELSVDEQCEVEFHIDRYKDNVICDIISMNACHILLGRPWQYDRDAVHYGKENCYKVDKDGMKHKLVPIKAEDTAGTSETRSQFLKQVESPKEKVTKIEPTTEKATEEEVPVSSPAEEVPAAEKTVDELPATVEISAEESTVTASASEPEAESGPAGSEQVEKPKEEAGPAAKEAEPAKEETVKPAEAAPAEEKAEVEGKAEE